MKTMQPMLRCTCSVPTTPCIDDNEDIYHIKQLQGEVGTAAALAACFHSHFIMVLIAAHYEYEQGVVGTAASPLPPADGPDYPLLPSSGGGDGFHGSYKLQSPLATSAVVSAAAVAAAANYIYNCHQMAMAFSLFHAALSAPSPRNWSGPSTSPARTVFFHWGCLVQKCGKKCKLANIVGNSEKSM